MFDHSTTWLDPLADSGENRIAHLPSSGAAALAWSLSQKLQHPLVIVVDGPRSLDALYQDLHTLGQGLENRLLFYPGWESIPEKDSNWNQDLAGDRLLTLQRCLDESDQALVIASDIQAVMQHTFSPEQLQKQTLTVTVNNEIGLEKLTEHLLAVGYGFEPEVTVKGEAARRGGLIDIWPPDSQYPLRLEFFGEEVDSIRAFDPLTQRSMDRKEELIISPAGPCAIDDQDQASLHAFLPPETAWIWYEPAKLESHGYMIQQATEESDAGATVIPYDDLPTPEGLQIFVGEDDDGILQLDLQPFAGLPALIEEGFMPERLEFERKKIIDGLIAQANDGWTIRACFNTEGSCSRFSESFPDAAALIPHSVRPLSEGYVITTEKQIVVGESDLYGVRKAARSKYDIHSKVRKGPKVGARIAEWTEIEEGAFVVHIEHGIGRYQGLEEVEFKGKRQEVLRIDYRDGGKVFLPVSQAHLLSRYVGVGKSAPRLHQLGGKRWSKEKLEAEQAVEDLAAELLETQARRETLPGHAFGSDTAWQHAFEATFPYQETIDQEESIAAVKVDMEKTRPMDRLICGDVGYGKTEVAMRAAFKAVMDGKQVAVLVPTTILAQQHMNSFRERMASFPFVIEMLSRFRTKKQQKEIVQGVSEGTVDIIIGTHRLVQSDVQFKDLGLVIIDEEQRFGVAHKERLKSIRELVDVLTLSATPIPRTLYMSLTGAKEMSTIMTPPQERLPIETIVAGFDQRLIRKAILRELNREGQVFFLHNRVQTIANMHERLHKMVPEAKIEFAHGQMPERELESIMNRFVDGQFDVLLCTTIIESGVDIPNTNTIIIDRADRFGMSELYQLRGRVGRYKHQAYAYLLLPQSGILSGDARKRIQAMQRYSSLGAGFKLALQDLEIRGAGNILGTAQSGHITAVGFDLYCQLLERSVKKMKKEPVKRFVDVTVKLDFLDLSPGNAARESAAVIPVAYIEDSRIRVDIYRKLASVSDLDELKTLGTELKDRFGKTIPPAMKRLLKVSEIRIRATIKRITEVEVREGKVKLSRGGEFIMPNKVFPRLESSTTSAKLTELIKMLKSV